LEIQPSGPCIGTLPGVREEVPPVSNLRLFG
jgi:hypothetical protein